MNRAEIEELLMDSKAEHEAALEKIKQIQEREEWFHKRRGRFTASEFHRLMGYEDNPKYDTELTKGGTSYAYEKYLETITEAGERYRNESMDRGNELEGEAAIRFMEETGLEVANTGDEQEFIELGEHVGCTPDGLVGDDAGLETKCPDSKTHDNYLTNIVDQESFKKVCKDYYYQIQGSMYVTGRSHWYFVSYDPRFKDKEEQLLILRIERNEEDIEKLKTRLRLAIGLKLSLLKKRKNRKILKAI